MVAYVIEVTELNFEVRSGLQGCLRSPEPRSPLEVV